MFFIRVSLMGLMVTSCLTPKLTHLSKDEGFDWDSIKRDQILMTPLHDWRPDPTAKHAAHKELDFFTEAERQAYPENFKQVFFTLRKDIRVFGAGGAFDGVSRIPGIADAGSLAINKQPLPSDMVTAITQRNQDIRFLLFFGVTQESLDHSFNTSITPKGCKTKTYRSQRLMEVKAGLWDSQANHTPWVATKVIAPQNVNTKYVGPHIPTIQKLRKAAKKRGKKFKAPVCGTTETDFRTATLASELRKNPTRFPSFPKREPSFSTSFKDLVLAIPMGRSERNLIEYNHFTNHRLAYSSETTHFRGRRYSGGALQFTSRKYNRYRLGVQLDGVSRTDMQNLESLSSASLLAIAEFDPREHVQIGFGVALGVGTLTQELQTEELDQDIDSDGYSHLHPLVNIQVGNRYGLQLFFRYMRLYVRGLEQSDDVKKTPDDNFGIGLSYTFRGI